MARINLLPWREELRKERQRQFAVVSVGSVVLMGLVLLLVHLRLAAVIDQQQSRNKFLQQHITEVEKQIAEIRDLEQQKQSLLDRMNVIQRLQRNRPEIVHLFDDIVRTVPDGVHLTSMKQTGAALTIMGMAQSNARVSTFMRNLDGSGSMTNPRLDVIKADSKGKDKDKDRASTFTLQVRQVSKAAQSEQNEGGGQ